MSSNNGNGNGSAPPVVRNDGALLSSLKAMVAQQKQPLSGNDNLGMQRQEDLSHHWLIAAMCNAYPDEATRNGWEVTLSENKDDETLTAFNNYREVIGGETEDEELISDLEIFSWAGYLANVYGGAAIVMGVDDGQPAREPINPTRIKTIKFLEVMDRHEIAPHHHRSKQPFSRHPLQTPYPSYNNSTGRSDSTGENV